MKKVLFSIVVIFLVNSSCYSQTNPTVDANNKPFATIWCDTAWCPNKIISLVEAEKVLLRSSHIKDSICDSKNGFARLSFTYVANTVDSSTKLRCSLFFGLEQYEQINGAQRFFERVKIENEKTNNFVSALDGVGDQAFLSKDEQLNPFILVQKKNRIYKFRTLHTNSKNSYDELIVLVRRIVANR